jgi:hypothetical protein
LGCTVVGGVAVVVVEFVVAAAGLQLSSEMTAVVSAEQVAEMTDDSVSAAAAVVVRTVAAADDDDVFVAAGDKHTDSVESCQFHCYPGSHPIEKVCKNNYWSQYSLFLISFMYPMLCGSLVQTAWQVLRLQVETASS